MKRIKHNDLLPWFTEDHGKLPASYLKSTKKIFEDKPEANKQYALTGGPGDKCISNGNSWKESEVNEKN